MESFGYDGLNRLTSYGDKTVNYDKMGNITQRSELGNLSYNLATKPYAVTDIENNGNLFPTTNQRISYTSFERPSSITDGPNRLEFTYNASGNRVKMQNLEFLPEQYAKYYLGDCYETDKHQSKLYLAGNYYSSPAVLIKSGEEAWQLYYLCRDHLGSITHEVYSDGRPFHELSYDAWGRLRNPNTQQILAYKNGTKPLTMRGYCSHELLAPLGLLNMNAQLYDLATGRFLSPDPYVQTPFNSQNFNRYSYCLNNPLCYVDEDGESALLIGIGIGAIIGAWMGMGAAMISSDHEGWGLAWDMCKGALIGGAAGAAGAAVGGAAAVDLNGAIGFIGGSLSGAAGGFTSGFVGGAGNTWLMQGGSFGQGLVSGFIGGGIGSALGGAMGGLSSGYSSLKRGGNFWTGKGATFVSAMEADGSRLGGEYFNDDATIHEYVKSKNGWERGHFGIDDISVEKNVNFISDKIYYYRDKGIISRGLWNEPAAVTEVAGITTEVYEKVFRSPRISVFLSPHSTLDGFTATLNHEFIHAYHRTLGLKTVMGGAFHNATEQSAYSYSLTHSTGISHLRNSLIGLTKFRSSYILPWPNYLIKY